MTALVSVLIPSYNYASYVLDAIDSVLAQTLPDVELLVVDDGSTDGSVELIRGHLREISPAQNVQFQVQDHRGICSTLNSFLATSRSTYITMLGADDLWEPVNLERQVSGLQDGGSAYGASYADCWIIDDRGRRWARWGANDGYREGMLYDDLVELRYFPPSATSVFVRSAVERVGGWPKSRRIVEDQDLWLRIAKEFMVRYVPEPLGSYRIHGDNASMTQLDAFYADGLATLRELLDRDPDLRPRARQLRARVEAKHAGHLYNALRLPEARSAAFAALRMDPRDGQAWRILARSSLGPRIVGALRDRRRARRSEEMGPPTGQESTSS